MFEKRLKAIDLANATNIAPSVISRYLSGQNQPSRDNIITIGNYLDTHPQSLLSSSDAPESLKKSGGVSSVTEPLLKTIAVQDKLIKNIEERVKELEEALGKKTTPDEAIKKLFDLIDQSGSYSAFATGRAGFDEKDEDQQWLQTEIGRLNAEMNTIRSMFFSDAEIRDSQHANLKRVRPRSPKRSKGGRPRKK